MYRFTKLISVGSGQHWMTVYRVTAGKEVYNKIESRGKLFEKFKGLVLLYTICSVARRVKDGGPRLDLAAGNRIIESEHTGEQKEAFSHSDLLKLVFIAAALLLNVPRKLLRNSFLLTTLLLRGRSRL